MILLKFKQHLWKSKQTHMTLRSNDIFWKQIKSYKAQAKCNTIVERVLKAMQHLQQHADTLRLLQILRDFCKQASRKSCNICQTVAECCKTCKESVVGVWWTLWNLWLYCWMSIFSRVSYPAISRLVKIVCVFKTYWILQMFCDMYTNCWKLDIYEQVRNCVCSA